MSKGKGATPRPRGRPTRYTRKAADEIITRLSLGESLAAICRSESLPNQTTICGWVIDDRNGFAERYARARGLQAQRWADEIIEISDDGTNDTYIATGRNGEDKVFENHDHINRSRLRVDTRKWLLSKLLPRPFGDVPRADSPPADDGDYESIVTVEGVILCRKVVEPPK